MKHKAYLRNTFISQGNLSQGVYRDGDLGNTHDSNAKLTDANRASGELTYCNNANGRLWYEIFSEAK